MSHQPRTKKIIQSDINKVKANITQVSAPGYHFYTKKDKEVLIPHYNKKLNELKLELETAII